MKCRYLQFIERRLSVMIRCSKVLREEDLDCDVEPRVLAETLESSLPRDSKAAYG